MVTRLRRTGAFRHDQDLASGGSAGAPLAIGTRRPVFVNDTEWFRDLPDRTKNLCQVSTLEELEHEMQAVLANEYAEQRSWDVVAETTVDAYRHCLSTRSAP